MHPFLTNDVGHLYHFFGHSILSKIVLSLTYIMTFTVCTHVISFLYFFSLHISSQHGTRSGLDYQQVLDMSAQNQPQ